MDIIILTTKELQECVDVVKRYYKLILTIEQMENILSKDKEAQESIQYFGASDTVERGTLADLVVQELGFDHWPLNMDAGTDFAIDFWRTVWGKAEERGYGVDTFAMKIE